MTKYKAELTVNNQTLKSQGDTLYEAFDGIKLDEFIKTGAVIKATFGKKSASWELLTAYRAKKFLQNKIHRDYVLKIFILPNL